MTSRDGLRSKVQRNVSYLVRKISRTGIDTGFERLLCEQAAASVTGAEGGLRRACHDEVLLSDVDVGDGAAFELVRDDIYRRFVADDDGPDTDSFGRRGTWIPRGSVLYLDVDNNQYVKLFDEYFCARGEGRFLGDALERGMYDVLCPGLTQVIVDDYGTIRGYSIEAGVPLSRYEFERYVGRCFRQLICDVTTHTGLYLNDLVYHNVVRHGDELSFIDLESVLPVEWYGTDAAFAKEHLDVVDIGWPIQSKWNSPGWYRNFLDGFSESDAQRGDDDVPR